MDNFCLFLCFLVETCILCGGGRSVEFKAKKDTKHDTFTVKYDTFTVNYDTFMVKADTFTVKSMVTRSTRKKNSLRSVP